MRSPLHTAPRRILAVTGAIALGITLVACSSTSTPSASSSAAPLASGSAAPLAPSSSAASGSCGTTPQIAPKDPDNLLKNFDASATANFNGFSTTVQASAWAKWKPTHAGPYTAALITTPPANPFQVTMTAAIRSDLKSAGVKLIFDQAAAGFTDIPQQLQLFEQAIQAKPDIILFQPLVSGAVVDAVNSAGKAGIPVIGVFESIDSKYAVNVANNNTAQGAILAADVFKQMGGKGTVLNVQGIPGIQADTDAQDGLKAAIAECPNIKIAGTVSGNYQNSLAQSAVLQYLATNPAGVDAIFHSGTMGLGILQAFEQSGRTAPLMADLGASRGAIVYAHDHPELPYFGSSASDAAVGSSIAQVAIRVLAGQGPKINQIVKTPEIITSNNLKDVYDSTWTAADSSDAALKDDKFLTTAQLDGYFADPKLALGK